MVKRLVYRSRFSYGTNSNQLCIVKTPRGILVYRKTKKKPNGRICPDTCKRIQGIPYSRSIYKRSRLSRKRRTPSQIIKERPPHSGRYDDYCRQGAQNPGHARSHVAHHCSIKNRHMKMLEKKLSKINIPSSILATCPTFSDHMDMPDIIFSWITKGGIELPPFDQRNKAICWAVMLQRSYNYFVALNEVSGYKLVTIAELVSSGVPHKYRLLDGVCNPICAREYMIDKGHVTDMVMHKRPLENYEEFETLVERLLMKAPVGVSFDEFPGINYYDYSVTNNGHGIFIPTVMEVQCSSYERFKQHYVVVTGYGAEQTAEGKTVKYWEFQNSYGKSWGMNGFGRLARGKGMIREAYEFKFSRTGRREQGRGVANGTSE